MSTNELYDICNDISSKKRHYKKKEMRLTRYENEDKIVINTTKIIMERKKYQ